MAIPKVTDFFFAWLLLCLCLLVACEDSKKDGPAEALVDQAFRFQISKPGPGWNLLPRDAAAEISANPDARLGASHADGRTGIVLVEPEPLDSLSDLADGMEARVSSSAAGFGDPPEVDREDLVFAGQPALSLTWKQGLSRRQTILFFYQNQLYRLRAVHDLHLIDPAKRKPLTPFFDAFSLLPGQVEPDVGRVEEPDQTGLGWWVRAGAYENVIERIRVEPSGPWRLLTGRALAKIDPRATVGLYSPEGTLVLQTLSALDPGQASVGLSEQDLKFQWAGGELILHPVSLSDREVLLGYIAHKGISLRVTVGFLTEKRKRVLDDLPQALAALEILDRGLAQALAQDLMLEPDPQQAFNRDYSLHRGVYRDFKHDLRWEKPDGFWAILPAPEQGGSATRPILSLVHLTSGSRAYLSEKPTRGFSAAAFHRQEAGLAHSAPLVETELGQVVGYVSSSGVNRAGLLVTALHKNRAYLFELNPGSDGDRSAIREAVSGLSFYTDNYQSQMHRDGALIELAYGFSYQPPEGFAATYSPRPIRSKLGARYDWQSPAGRFSIQVLIDTESSGGTRWVDLASSSLFSKETLHQDRARRSEQEFAGQTWEHRTWPRLKPVHAWLSRRGRLIYVLTASGTKGDLDTQALLDGFSFLDGDEDLQPRSK